MAKKNWLKNLIFVDAEPEVNETKSKQQVQEKHSPKPISETSPKPRTNEVSAPRIEKQIDPDTIIGKVDKALLAKLCRVLDEQPAQDIDYVKFKKAADSLKAIQPEENVRFASTFLTLKVTNPKLSKEYLIQTIDKYIGLMEQERKVGMDQLKGLRSKDVDTKNNEIAEARRNVEKMKADILRLSKFIAETETDIISKQNEIAVKEADFNTTINSMINQLKNDRTKIESYIK